ncbi:DEAD/DEAH box helicase [Nocardioides fonticola]|uniref:DEAD/DEAH box helicase n=1 Tax=Nocardioides fonticola TaxID=450363 RepID=A0ABP7XDN2_9ACTN
MDILDLLADSDPADFFGERELERGAEYYAHDRLFYVENTTRESDRVSAMCFAHGSGRQTYVVHLDARVHAGRLSLGTTCTCPVGRQCKHGAGLYWAVRPVRSVSRPRTWREEFDELTLVADDLLDAGRAVGVALAFEREPARYGYGGSGSRITLRPMRPGARQPWVRTGLSWNDVPRAVRDGDYDARQLAALDALQRSLGAANHWYNAATAPPLDDFGPQLVPLLRQARDAGVVLLPIGLPPLEVLDGTARVAVDVVERGTGASVLVGIAHPAGFTDGEEVQVIGSPAHTALLPVGTHLALVELAPPIRGAALALLQRAEPILVPAEEVPELTERLGALTRALPVASSDGSVEVPELPAPRLRVTVTWQSAALADVHWEWCYGTLPPFDLDETDTAPGPVLRDAEAEAAITARLDPLPDRARSTSAGADALHLALLALPVWRSVEGVEVVEHDPPAFRESHEAPQFSFEAAPPADDGLAAGAGHRPEHTDWLDLEVMIRVEGQQVPLAHVLEALTLGQTHLVLPSGLYLSLDRPEFARLAEIVKAAAEVQRAPDGQLRVGRRDLGLWAQLDDLGIVDAQAAEWVAKARALRDLVELPRPEPIGVASTLRSYQLEGFRWLAFLWQHRLGGILADDMGLGKTLQVLALIAHTRAEEPLPFLVVAPTSVVSGWASEAALHTPGLRVRTVEATAARRAETLAEIAEGADVVVTSYALLRLDAAEYAGIGWAGVVLDEAQQVKNHQSKAYAAVKSLGAQFLVAVTGTPFENRLMELWSLLSLAAPGLYSHPGKFTETVVRPVERNGDAAALGRLTARIKPFVLRRTKELVAADLPPKQEQVLHVELNARHRRLYDAHLAKERQRVLGLVEEDFDRNRVAILAALTRLRQLALDPGLVDEAHANVGSAKLDVLLDHLAELAAEGHRALVFSQFTTYLKRVRERLEQAGIASEYLDGATTARGRVIERFRTGEAPVFLISLKAGGTGLTLTEADYVFVLDPWWNPAAEAQAVDRAHRIGQQRTVMVYRLVSTETIEEKVMALKDRKAAIFSQVVDGGAGLSAGVSAEDIRGLFD